jgi:hypothetical protein
LKLLEKLNRISIYYNHINSSNARGIVNIPHNINFPLEKNRIVITARPEDLPFNGTAPDLKKITFKKRSNKSKAEVKKIDPVNTIDPVAEDKISRLKKLGFSL